jgi:PAS domain S-box-containing protein
MIRLRILPESIVTKLIMMNVLILFAFGGVIIVNFALSRQTRNTIITLVDKDVPQIIRNEKLSRNLNQVTADIHVLVTTFTSERNILSLEKNRIIPILKNSISSAGVTHELGSALRHFTQAVENLLNQCAKIDDLLKTTESINRQLVGLIGKLETKVTDGIIERKLGGRDYELYSFEQVSASIPDFENLLLRVSILLSDSERAHFKREKSKINYEKKILTMLGQLDSGLTSATTAGEELAPFGKALIKNVEQYKTEIIRLHRIMRELQTKLGALYQTQSEVITIIMKMDNKITDTTEDMRKIIVEYLRSSSNLILALSLFVVAVLTGVSIYGVKIARPIQELTVSASEIAAGNLERTIRTGGSGEIGILAHSFVKMRDAIKEKMDNSLQQNKELSQEIMEHKRTADALRESEKRFRDLSDSLPQVVFETDDEGNLTFANKNAFDVFGFTKDDFDKGINILQTLAPSEHIRALENYKNVMGGKQLGAVEYISQKKDGGTFPVAVHANPIIRDNKAVGLRGILIDLTEQKKLENRLRQGQKMEAIGTLAGGIAHDFNNILGIILGNAELAMDHVPEWHPARLNLEEIRIASVRAKDLVRQLLSFARKTRREKRPTNIVPIIEESLRLLRSSIPTSIEIRQNIPKKVDIILADPTQINQILINLSTNASHAMPDGGILEVDLRHAMIDEDTAAQYADLNPGRYVNLIVKDTGYGIPKEHIHRIFDPYFTTKEVGKGTGMGLAVVHGIVKEHKGIITMKSEAGKGTTFSIFFPIVEKEAVADIETDEKLPTGNERILFIDDEESIAKLGCQVLERLGYHVEETISPIEALDIFRSKSDKFDLVITDLTMPKMTGDKLVKEILAIRPDIPIILCTGFSERIDEKNAKAMGVADYIEKPLDKLSLAVTVRRVLDGEKS